MYISLSQTGTVQYAPRAIVVCLFRRRLRKVVEIVGQKVYERSFAASIVPLVCAFAMHALH